MALKWSAYQVQHNFVSAPVVCPALKPVLKQEPHGQPATAPLPRTIQMSPKDQTPAMTQVPVRDQGRDRV